MHRLRMPRRAAAVGLGAAVVSATVAGFVPRAASAAQALSGGQDSVVPMLGVSHPARVPLAKAATVHSGGRAPLPRLSRPRVASASPGAVQAQAVRTGAVHRLNAPAVSAASAQGVDQLQAIQGVSNDLQPSQVSPPDTTMSASATTVVEAVNSELLIMNHDGGNQQVVQLQDLWGAAIPAVQNGTDAISDPRIIWDPTAGTAGRWFTSIVYYQPAVLNGTPGTYSWIGMAISTDDTPTTWDVYSVQSASGTLMDQPNMGINGDKVVVGANDFHPNWSGAELVVASKADMVANVSLHVSRRADTNAFGYAPAVASSSPTTEYVAYNNQTFDTHGNPTSPQWVSVIEIGGVPGTSTVTYTQHDLVICPSCGNNGVTGQTAPVPQPNSAVAVDGGDDRFLGAVWQGNMLWTGGSTAVQGAASGITIFGVDTSGWTLPQSEIVSSSNGESFAYPAFALNGAGDQVFISFSRGGATRAMSSGAFVFLPGSQSLLSAGVLSGGAGQGPFDCGGGCDSTVGGTTVTRWGDYSGAAVDPSDPTTAWVSTEYSAVGNGRPENWGTLITRVTLDPPTAATSSPTSGSTRGGTTVAVTGTYLDVNTTVLFGGVPAQGVRQLDPQHLLALSPPHRPGTVDVTVSTLTGSATLPGAFTYLPPPRSRGYWLDASDGGIFPFGNATGWGSTGNIRLNQPMVGMASLPDGSGYWLVAADGGIFPFGNAVGWGSTGNIHLNRPVVGMAPTPDGNGYWLVASDGGIFPFGDAGGYGSTGGIRLNQPVVGMASTPTGHGYWLVASDGGIFPFGDAVGWGSTGNIRLNQPIVGMAATSDGGGYWLVASDGGIFPFGDAVGWGSTGGIHLNQPVVGMAQTGDDGGYWLVASDGGIFPFGDAVGYGSTGNIRLNRPMVGMAASQP